MKLYFTGNEKGNLSYTTDGVRFTSTTLDALRNGVQLPDNTDYTKVQVKAGSNVFSALDVVKKVELVQGGEVDTSEIKNALGIHLICEEPSSYDGELTIDQCDYHLAYLHNEYNTDDFNIGEIIVAFKKKSSGEVLRKLKGSEHNDSDWEYVLGYQERGFVTIMDLGPIDPFFVN